ncbi:MAG: 3-dehydroquinate synthase [Treponema sp.]|nr:3-dehydroquinate synthase [Treponema sp.]
MARSTFQIKYPSIHSGTDKSKIHFLKGTPNLVDVFNLSKEITDSKKRVFVTDGTVASLDCMQNFISMFDDNECGNDVLVILGSGEAYKSMESVLTIVKAGVEKGLTRNDTFIGIGGGVICDTTAFAASIYKRGASVQLVPTTLLAMVDASIGGKTGCDFENYKNMIGSFFPAKELYYWPEFIQYLPENQFSSGLGEAFKTAILFDQELFDIFKNESKKINARDKDILDIVIRKCVSAKAAVVEEDFTEKGIRATLNLGHTFGHALETIVGLGSISHGAAIAWGIGRAVTLAYKKEYCSESFYKEVFAILEAYGWETAPVPSIVKGGGIGERFLTVMHKDKKNLNSTIRLIISKGIQDTVIEEVEDSLILSVLK